MYLQTVELIKIPEMVLSENTLRQIITGAQVTNRALKQQLRMPTIRFLMLTFNWLLTISCSSYMQRSTLSRGRDYLMFTKAFTGIQSGYPIGVIILRLPHPMKEQKKASLLPTVNHQAICNKILFFVVVD